MKAELVGNGQIRVKLTAETDVDTAFLRQFGWELSMVKLGKVGVNTVMELNPERPGFVRELPTDMYVEFAPARAGEKVEE